MVLLYPKKIGDTGYCVGSFNYIHDFVENNL